jgi:hypothetical protein
VKQYTEHWKHVLWYDEADRAGGAHGINKTSCPTAHPKTLKFRISCLKTTNKTKLNGTLHQCITRPSRAKTLTRQPIRSQSPAYLLQVRLLTILRSSNNGHLFSCMCDVQVKQAYGTYSCRAMYLISFLLVLYRTIPTFRILSTTQLRITT